MIKVNYFNAFFNAQCRRFIRSPFILCFQLFYVPVFILLMYGYNFINQDEIYVIISQIIFLSCSISFIFGMSNEVWEFENTDIKIIYKLSFGYLNMNPIRLPQSVRGNRIF